VGKTHIPSGERSLLPHLQETYLSCLAVATTVEADLAARWRSAALRVKCTLLFKRSSQKGPFTVAERTGVLDINNFHRVIFQLWEQLTKFLTANKAVNGKGLLIFKEMSDKLRKIVITIRAHKLSDVDKQ